MKNKIIGYLLKLMSVMLIFAAVSALFYVHGWKFRIFMGHFILFVMGYLYYAKRQFTEWAELCVFFMVAFAVIIGVSPSARNWLVEQGHAVGLNPAIISDLLIMMLLSALTALGVKFFLDSVVRLRLAL